MAVKAQVKKLIQEAADLARQQAALAEEKAVVRHPLPAYAEAEAAELIPRSIRCCSGASPTTGSAV